MSVYAAPDAVGMGPPPGAGGPPPGDPSSMAALAAALGQGGGGAPPGMDPSALGGGMPPGLDPSALGGGGLDPSMLDPSGGAGGDQGGDLGGLGQMNATDHIRAAIKHLMMAMTESGNDEQSHGIAKGMTALHSILAGDAKNAKTVAAASG